MSAQLGAFLRDLPPLHTVEKPVSFDPVQTTFLQKLVRESTLQQGVSVRKEDFFRTIAALDYFMEVVAARATLLEDVRVLVAELERIAEYLDPDLELLVRYLGIYVGKDLKGEELLREASLSAMLARHERGNARPAASPTGVDPFHLSCGRMVLDLVQSRDVRRALPGLRGRNDLRAALLVDAALSALPPSEIPEDAQAALTGGDFARTLPPLLGALHRASSGWSLRGHVDALRARL